MQQLQDFSAGAKRHGGSSRDSPGGVGMERPGGWDMEVRNGTCTKAKYNSRVVKASLPAVCAAPRRTTPFWNAKVSNEPYGHRSRSSNRQGHKTPNMFWNASLSGGSCCPVSSFTRYPKSYWPESVTHCGTRSCLPTRREPASLRPKSDESIPKHA